MNGMHEHYEELPMMGRRPGKRAAPYSGENGRCGLRTWREVIGDGGAEMMECK